jgi:3-oxoacyl-[acyl-carrier-protein] synthase II
VADVAQPPYDRDVNSHQDRRRVVVSGIGVRSPNATGAAAFAEACLAGRSGLKRTPVYGDPAIRTAAVGAIDDFDPASVIDPADVKRLPRMVPLAIAAAREAMSMANLAIATDDHDAQRQVACVLGTGGGGLAFVEQQYQSFFRDGRGSLYSITGGTHGNLSSEISIALGLRGPSHVLSDGCAASTDAIGYAMLMIRSGIVPRVLVGGADAPIAHGILHAFERMKVISTRQWDDPRKASRPFSRDRDGFVLGEGAWMFLLEDADAAETRGVSPLAELLGFASTCDAYHRVQIAPDVVESSRAITLALADAGVERDAIEYVNLHGTGTELNDRLETAAMHRVFGARARAIPMSTTKSLLGHPQGAGGAAGLAATILCLRQGGIHPTLNLDEPDPECDLDYVPHRARATSARLALCNCIAFGSKNSALVVRVGDA